MKKGKIYNIDPNLDNWSCSSIATDQFACSEDKTKCIKYGHVCDGYDNCGNRWAASGKDEGNCELGTLYELNLFPYSHVCILSLLMIHNYQIIYLRNYISITGK